MLTSASGALIKETKEVNLVLKITFFYIFKWLTTQVPRELYLFP
jgi:hypothetical protein